jgi:hypothetical protein
MPLLKESIIRKELLMAKDFPIYFSGYLYRYSTSPGLDILVL